MPSASTPDPPASNPPSPTPLPDPPTPPPQDNPTHTTTQLKSPPLPIPTPTFTDEPMPPPQLHPPSQHAPTSVSQPSQTQVPATSQHQQPNPNPHAATPASNPRQSQNRRAPTSRRPSHRSTRVGRPPNINENCLMRRLECVMAVDSGRMSMLTACQQYDISARTFYRWLRDKHRLIELTGFTEDDFRNNPPWTNGNEPNAAQETEGGELVHDPNQQEEVDVQENLPRLSAQAGGRGRGGGGGFMGMKRRFPKGSESRGGAFADSAGGAYRSGTNAQQVYYARRAFTKMPSKNVRTNRREGWEEGEGGFVEGGYGEFAGEGEGGFKRRKVVREGEEEGADGEEDAAGEGEEFANGNVEYAGRKAGAPSGGMGGEKHRIEIMMGRRKVAIAWYEDAGASDIKAAIARRFALLPGTQWALMDKNLDEIVISAGMPSGRYTLTVFS